MISRRGLWVLFSKRVGSFRSRPLCTNSKIDKPNITGNSNDKNGSKEVHGDGSLSSRIDAYRELDNLNFVSAAKILFSDPPKKKKFGLDFHLVQLFFVCLPSLAVYLVSRYARYEMRIMEAELKEKKKAEDEAKAKEMELKALEEEEKRASDPHFLAVKARLEKLEEAIKEIVDASKKKSNDADGNIKVEETEKDQSAKIESNKNTIADSNAEDNSQKQMSKGSTSSPKSTETFHQNRNSSQKAEASSDTEK